MTTHSRSDLRAIHFAVPHGRRRANQRGTNGPVFSTVNDWADVEVSVGSGAVSLSVSWQAAREMRAEGVRQDLIERACRRALVQVDGRTLTVIAGREPRGRYYWRSAFGRRRNPRHR